MTSAFSCIDFSLFYGLRSENESTGETRQEDKAETFHVQNWCKRCGIKHTGYLRTCISNDLCHDVEKVTRRFEQSAAVFF